MAPWNIPLTRPYAEKFLGQPGSNKNGLRGQGTED
jgi:hypothetical protein